MLESQGAVVEEFNRILSVVRGDVSVTQGHGQGLVAQQVSCSVQRNPRRGIDVTDGGNVGIGEVNSSAALDVVGTTELNGQVTINSNLFVVGGTATVNGNTVWHGGNDGTGSTLDADLLDGKDATEFLDTSATPQTKAGDLTVGGNLTLTAGGLEFPDGSVQTSAANFLPPDTCFDNVGRFVVCGDGAVKDNLTGLFWLENANCFGTLNWADANIPAAQLGDGQWGLTDGSSPGDWRLPTEAEWQVVVDQANLNACPAPFFPDTLGTGCCGVDPCGFAGCSRTATGRRLRSPVAR
jgi:hypothetical protein